MSIKSKLITSSILFVGTSFSATAAASAAENPAASIHAAHHAFAWLPDASLEQFNPKPIISEIFTRSEIASARQVFLDCTSVFEKIVLSGTRPEPIISVFGNIFSTKSSISSGEVWKDIGRINTRIGTIKAQVDRLKPADVEKLRKSESTIREIILKLMRNKVGDFNRYERGFSERPSNILTIMKELLVSNTHGESESIESYSVISEVLQHGMAARKRGKLNIQALENVSNFISDHIYTSSEHTRVPENRALQDIYILPLIKKFTRHENDSVFSFCALKLFQYFEGKPLEAELASNIVHRLNELTSNIKAVGWEELESLFKISTQNAAIKKARMNLAIEFLKNKSSKFDISSFKKTTYEISHQNILFLVLNYFLENKNLVDDAIVNETLVMIMEKLKELSIESFIPQLHSDEGLTNRFMTRKILQYVNCATHPDLIKYAIKSFHSFNPSDLKYKPKSFDLANAESQIFAPLFNNALFKDDAELRDAILHRCNEDIDALIHNLWQNSYSDYHQKTSVVHINTFKKILDNYLSENIINEKKYKESLLRLLWNNEIPDPENRKKPLLDILITSDFKDHIISALPSILSHTGPDFALARQFIRQYNIHDPEFSKIIAQSWFEKISDATDRYQRSIKGEHIVLTDAETALINCLTTTLPISILPTGFLPLFNDLYAINKTNGIEALESWYLIKLMKNLSTVKFEEFEFMISQYNANLSNFLPESERKAIIPLFFKKTYELLILKAKQYPLDITNVDSKKIFRSLLPSQRFNLMLSAMGMSKKSHLDRLVDDNIMSTSMLILLIRTLANDENLPAIIQDISRKFRDNLNVQYVDREIDASTPLIAMALSGSMGRPIARLPKSNFSEAAIDEFVNIVMDSWNNGEEVIFNFKNKLGYWRDLKVNTDSIFASPEKLREEEAKGEQYFSKFKEVHESINIEQIDRLLAIIHASKERYMAQRLANAGAINVHDAKIVKAVNRQLALLKNDAVDDDALGSLLAMPYKSYSAEMLPPVFKALWHRIRNVPHVADLSPTKDTNVNLKNKKNALYALQFILEKCLSDNKYVYGYGAKQMHMREIMMRIFNRMERVSPENKPRVALAMLENLSTCAVLIEGQLQVVCDVGQVSRLISSLETFYNDIRDAQLDAPDLFQMFWNASQHTLNGDKLVEHKILESLREKYWDEAEKAACNASAATAATLSAEILTPIEKIQLYYIKIRYLTIFNMWIKNTHDDYNEILSLLTNNMLGIEIREGYHPTSQELISHKSEIINLDKIFFGGLYAKLEMSDDAISASSSADLDTMIQSISDKEAIERERERDRLERLEYERQQAKATAGKKRRAGEAFEEGDSEERHGDMDDSDEDEAATAVPPGGAAAGASSARHSARHKGRK